MDFELDPNPSNEVTNLHDAIIKDIISNTRRTLVYWVYLDCLKEIVKRDPETYFWPAEFDNKVYAHVVDVMTKIGMLK